MSGTELAMALSLIVPTVKAAKDGIELVKSWIDEAFSKGTITKEEREQLMTQIKALEARAENDSYPDHWKQQPE